MQAETYFRLFFTRKIYVLFIAIATLVVVVLRSRDNLPFSPGYTFPLLDYLVHFLGTLLLWEIQFWTFRHVYKRKLYEQGFSLKLVMQVLTVNLAITFLFYAVFAPSVVVWVYRVPFTIYGFVVGLLLTLVFALIINLLYLSMQVYQYWQLSSQQAIASPEETSPTAPAGSHVAASGARRFSSDVYINTGNEELRIPNQEVAYFYTEQKVTFAMTKAARRLITQYTLSELEAILDPTCFFKINRQVIAHRQAIVSVRKEANYKLQVQLEPVRGEIVSRYKAAEFREWFREPVHPSEQG